MFRKLGRGGKFFPTEIGLVVTDLLVVNLKDVFEAQFTARMEEELDEIEEGQRGSGRGRSGGVLRQDSRKTSAYAEKAHGKRKRMEKPTDEKCERCGSPLVIKWGKHGSFYACSSYDKEGSEYLHVHEGESDRSARPGYGRFQETKQEEYCENCGSPMVLKRGRFGQFMACTGYPECQYDAAAGPG